MSRSRSRSRPITPLIGIHRDPYSLDAWILGSGLTSLTAAVHLIQEANVPASKVHILESLSMAGGRSVSAGDAKTGYDYRAGLMPNFNDGCMEELLSLVPSSENPGKSVFDDIHEYYEKNAPKQCSYTRFLTRKNNGLERIDAKRLNVSIKDRMDLFMVASKTESALGRSRIHEYFSDSFFKTNYWLILSTTFGFQPWHSAAEFRRCLQRFMHDMHDLNSPRPLDRVRYNFHESIIAPIARFLLSKGVDFHFHTIVTDIVTEPSTEPKRVSAIRAVQGEGGPETTIEVGLEDIVIVSVGSVTSGSARGTNTSPPSLELMEIDKDLDENWLLWLEVSTKNSKFGNAYNFCTRMQESRVMSFTVTLKNPEYFKRFAELTGDNPGTGVLVTLKDSSWLLSLSIPRQPLFPDQPDDVQVFWGYALNPEKEGDFVKKPMLSCSGEEIMTELLHQLYFPLESIMRESITIPCVMPRMGAALLPRTSGDRPQVIPQGMTNVALIEEFVDIPDEVVTIDYSVRGAQMAVNYLMGLDKELKKSKRGSAINLLGF